ncbi:chymotrypsin family serine protease [Terrabacter terrigena]|uniref:Serine protease n=1 Tax=Terrabacter terrigena TaxID=574718 RepID=A0ABW3MUL4_9MICO
MDQVEGRVELKFQPTTNQEFLSLVARERAAFGELFIASETSNGASPRAALTTKGGYGTSAYSGNPANPMYTGCTMAFNVVKGGVYHFVTAAHCVQADTYSGTASTPWFYTWAGGSTLLGHSDGTYLGQNAASFINPPSGDMAVIRYSSTNTITAYGTVYYGTGSVDVTGFGPAVFNDWSCTFGAKTKAKHCAAIDDVCRDVHYGAPWNVTINCMIHAPIGTFAGDSGSPLWVTASDGVSATGVGVLSGGSSVESFYSWVIDARTRWGVDAY